MEKMDNLKMEIFTVCLLFYAEKDTVEAIDSMFACDYGICVMSGNLCSCFSQKTNTNKKKQNN